MLKRSIVAAAFALAACGGSSGPATHFGATLSSANETPTPPAPNAAGAGTATYTVGADGGTIDYTVTWSGLSANASAGHIHVGAPTEAGPVVVPFTLTKTTADTITGTINATNIKCTPDPCSTASATVHAGNMDELLAAMRAGNTYTNIHTSNNPAGEIRGQNKPQ